MKTDLQIEQWPIDRLIPYVRNARTHSPEQVAQIAASIVEFGFTNPILVDTNAGIIAGHGRLLAARKLGLSEVPVIVLDHLTEAQRRALVLADNKLALNAGWDEEMLRVELQDLEVNGFNLDLIGFSAEEMEIILAGGEQTTEGQTDEDAVPETQVAVVSAPGDVWIMGDHRLLCGDSTQLEAVEKVLAGGLADMVFCDPPYGVAYVGKTAKKLTIANDNLGDDFEQFLRDACVNMLAVNQGRNLHLHVVFGDPHAAAGVPRGGRALVHFRRVGEEHFHDGAVRLPASVRTDPLRMEGRHGSFLVPGGSYVLLCGSGLRDTVGMRFCGDVAFRILSVIQVRTTLGWRPLSIYNYCSRTTMSIRRCWVRVHGEAG